MTKRRHLRRRTLKPQQAGRLSSRSLHHETLEKRELLAAEFGADPGPRLISVAANSGEQFDLDGGNLLSEAPRELTFRFDGARPLDPDTLSAIQFVGSGGDGSFDDGNEVPIIPGFLGFADDTNPRIVVARFADTLPDDQYQITVSGFDDSDPVNPVVALRNIDGTAFCPPGSEGDDEPRQIIEMDVEVGPRVLAIVPQPVIGAGAGRAQLRNTIHVYFNDDPLSNPNAGIITDSTSALSVVNKDFYKLLYTHDTVENTDDGAPIEPQSVLYDPVLNRVTLTYADDLSELTAAAARNGVGTYRLRVGADDAIPTAPTQPTIVGDPGDIFADAADLAVPFGAAGSPPTQSVVVSNQAIVSTKDVIPQWPGAYDVAGLRDYRRDPAIVGRVDTNTGINRYEYNFATLYGLDPQLNQLDNAITPAQRQRAREILELYGNRIGVEFVETANRGLQIVTGDLRSIAVSADTGEVTGNTSDPPLSIYRVNEADPTRGVLVLDAGENWFDGYGLSPDNRPSWFVEALRGVGSLLGIGNTYELPEGDASGGTSPPEPNATNFIPADPNVPVEPDFLSQGNIITGQALHRPESDDIDFYSFTASQDGLVKLETFAQRLEDSSRLDTHLKLYQVLGSGEYELIASNDDFFSDDSFVRVNLELPRDAGGSPIPTEFIIGVSASGNDTYNGEVEGSGLGGLSEGAYDLRVTFESAASSTITDTNGTELDGDADGIAGGDFNFWFRVARDTGSPAANEPRVLFVDKLTGDDNLVANPDGGTLNSPLKTVAKAFDLARRGDIVRLLANGGADGVVDTRGDNLPYEIGRGGAGNVQLGDGGEFEVPGGVTVMIDAGAILKLQKAKISVGSESVDEDRSLAALQVLGTPTVVAANGNSAAVDATGARVDGLGSVFFTSFDDASIGVDNNTLTVPPQAGNWAGIEFRNDFDFEEGRPVYESEGIFLDYSSHANIRFGGGSISATAPAVTAISMSEARPTLIGNRISQNAGAAISADPNSFRETNFHSPIFQRVDSFTSDYQRVGPEIYNNTLVNNTTNGLFIRVVTPAAGQLEPMQVSGRFDDRDIVHVLTQVLVLQGSPGGPLLLEERPDVGNVTFADGAGTLNPGDMYDYRVSFVTSEGRESLASVATSTRVAPAAGGIQLNDLPPAPDEFAGRRIYRRNLSTGGSFEFVRQLDRDRTTFLDNGTTRGGAIPAPALDAERDLPRFDARLSIDPGLIVKLENARIEAGFGSDFYAEGDDGDSVIFTSLLDDSFGASGTFDTNNSTSAVNRGDWGGLVFRQDATASLDHVEIQYGGGTTPIEGGFTEFNAVEILQADVRIANSVLRKNEDGFISNSIRGGRGFNDESVVFVRGAQPRILENTFIDNVGAAISINPDSFGFEDVLDEGRATGPSDVIVTDADNQGPLIHGNRLDRNSINGLVVRSQVLRNESIWDDTDIVHVVAGEIHTMTHYHRGGLRLKSDANQSLVVKFDNDATLVGSGRPLDIEDRIGGTLQVLGTPGNPVILTSIEDCSVGAGFTPEGIGQNDTIESGLCQPPMANAVTTVDVIVVMDESGSMFTTQQFSAQFIQDLEAGLLAAGIGVDNPNQYGAVGFGGGGAGNLGRTVQVGGGLFGTAAEYAAATSNYVISGVIEDGYAGIDFALDNYPLRDEAAKFIVLATDEDRDPETSDTLQSVLADLQANDVALQGILGVTILDNNNNRALALDNTQVYTQAATGNGFTASPGGMFQFASGNTLTDYVPLVQATGGITADLFQIGTSQQTADSFSQVLVSSLIDQAGGSQNPAVPGSWTGLQLETYINDRNVAYVVESERAVPAAIGENAVADTAQVIGDLAAHEFAGDENERLGFNIRGALASPADQDVYRFTANGGTEVFIDIDDTSFGLDTVVELIDVNDQVLASSDNSFAETSDPSLLVNNLSPGAVRPLFQLGTGNVESPNSLDAGMRVVLDGTGDDNTYFVRVRSAHGRSSGQYGLSIRLRETDEIAGSTVQLAEIRFATDAISVSGAPLHSPLAGDATENLNYLADGTPVDVDNTALTFTEVGSTAIGNLLTSDRGSLRVSGTIGNVAPNLAFRPSDDIDVYQVDLFAQDISPDVFDSENRFVSTTFDIDYADGLGRVNTSLAVYDSNGRLILHGRDSNVADDVGRPLRGDDPTNLSGGSVGVLDAHIGPVDLQEGTYYVAVSSAVAVPQALDQFFEPNPTNTEVRLMPINALRRIADDGLDIAGYTADQPIIEPLFDNSSIVPFGFDDVRLFVSFDQGISGNNRTSLASFNPFTGVMDRLIGQSLQRTGDLATRRDGELFTYTIAAPPGVAEDNGNIGNFLNISPADGTETNVGDDTITFQRNNAAGNDLEADDNAQLDILAMAFPLVDYNGPPINRAAIPNGDRFFLVGQRDNRNFETEFQPYFGENIFYTAQSNSGEITSLGSTNANAHRMFMGTRPFSPAIDGAASADREWGIIDTGKVFGIGDGGLITGLAQEPDGGSFGDTMFAVTDQGGIHRFDYRTTVTGPQGADIIPTTYFGILEPDPADTVSVNQGFVEFESLAFGPRALGSELRNTMIAVSESGFLYAFEVDSAGGTETIVKSNVFYNGQSAIPLVFEGGGQVTANPHGLAFSVLEENPWHFTNDRGANDGHGIEIPHDNSRVDTTGGTSLYFGFEVTGNAADNTVGRAEDDALGQISPGGTQGTVVSKPFNLEGYSPDDKPTLYFSYFIEVEADDDYAPPEGLDPEQNDSFRAYAAGDDGRWLLLATNDSFRDLGFFDEYDTYDDSQIPVQEIFDDSNAWRQARVDLSPLAGNEQVRIRFDFSTAGNLKHQFGSIELVAVNGDEIQDNETASFRNERGQTIRLQSIVGRDIVVPAASALAVGDSFEIDRIIQEQDGFGTAGNTVTTTVNFVAPGTASAPTATSVDVEIIPGASSVEMADAVVAAIPKEFRPERDFGGQVSLFATTSVRVLGTTPIGQSNPASINRSNLTQLVTPSGANLSSGEQLTISGPAGATLNITFGNGPGEFNFTTADSAFNIASRLIRLIDPGFDPIIELDGRITFLEQPVTLTRTAPSAANEVFAGVPIRQNRLEILVPDGNGLNDGDLLRISGINGDADVLFRNVPTPPTNDVQFTSADSNNMVAMNLLAVLQAEFPLLDARLNALGDGVTVVADNATSGNFNLVDVPIAGTEVITFPGGSSLMNDTVTVRDELGQDIVINFIEGVGVDVPATPGANPATRQTPGDPTNPGTIFYQNADTADAIAAKFAAAIANFFVSDVDTDTVTVYGAVETTPSFRPTPVITHGPTLGQIINLPPLENDLINNEEIRIFSPLLPASFGANPDTRNLRVRFSDVDFSSTITVGNEIVEIIGYNNAAFATPIERLLQDTLEKYSGLRAIVTPNSTSGHAVQILGATDVVTLDGASLIEAEPNTYDRNVVTLDIKDGVDLKNGEQIRISVPGGFFPTVRTITFVRAGSTSVGTPPNPISFTSSDTAADLYDKIIQLLPQSFQAYVDLSGDGLNIGAPGATAVTIDGVTAFAEGTVDINESAVPITLPGGAELNDGEQLTIISKDDTGGNNPITITFNLSANPTVPGSGVVNYSLADTADVITSKLYDALPLNLQGFIFSSREIYLLNASSVAVEPGSSIVSFQTTPGAIPVQLYSTMTSNEVARQLQISLAEGFGRFTAANALTNDTTSKARPDAYPVIGGDRIRLYNAQPIDVGSYGVSNYSSQFFTSSSFNARDATPLPAEVFGEELPSGFAPNQIDSQGGANNEIEGVYIDDIIIGFAERGEMVLNAPANNRNFVVNPETLPEGRPEAVQPERNNETLTGPYSLEIRTSEEYGVPEDFDPIRYNLDFLNGRSFDTNDRLADGAVTLIALPGQKLIDGDTFVLDDGTRQMTFEFDSNLDTSVPSVAVGNVAVPFDPSGDMAEEVAASIRGAINSTQSRNVLDITAATGDGLEVGITTSKMVELFGPAITVNPGGGRFIKVDMVKEETFQGRETSRQIPIVDHVNQTVTYQTLGDQQARATVSNYVDASTDVLVAIGKIGDRVDTGEIVDRGPVVLSSFEDDDFIRIYLEAGKPVDIDLDTEGWTRGAEIFDSGSLQVRDTNGVVLASSNLSARAPGEIFDGGFINDFVAPVDGYYDVVVNQGNFGGGFFFFFGGGEYILTVRPGDLVQRDVVMVDYHFGKGDVNRVKDQGQIIIASNFIKDASQTGIVATAGGRGENFVTQGNNASIGINTVPDNLPRPGSANLLRNVNTDQLIPGAVISNNVVVDSGGIVFAGGTANNGESPASVPIGRIVNNTVVGTGGGSGITVSGNASPTLLNNLVVGFDTGFDIDATAEANGTTVGGNAFQDNNVNSTIPLAESSFVVNNPVFQDPARRIYIPSAGSIVIDSSFSSLPDRGDFDQTVKDPVGISESPIIAPLFDVYGQPRFDDPSVNPPGAGGDIVSIDRGGIDRADFTPLVASLTSPQDAVNNVVAGGDRDPDESFVRLLTGTVEFFEVQLTDPAGTGPDKDTITVDSVLLTENGRRLVPGVDFTFGYSDNSNTIRLTPLAGLWLPDAVYEITLNNQARLAFEAPDGRQISDADQVIITDESGLETVFEFESGFSVVVPQTTFLTVTGTNTVFNDRDTFTIEAPSGNALTFEINRAGSVAVGNVPVGLSQTTTISEVRDAILLALGGTVPGDPTTNIVDFLNLVPVAVGNDRIQLGTLDGHIAPDPIAGLEVGGVPGGIADGQTFTYSTPDDTVVFEFDSNNAQRTADSELIPFTRGSTPVEIARQIVDAVQRRPLGLTSAVAIEDGTVVLGGSVGDTLSVVNSRLISEGAPGVTGPLTLTVPQNATGTSLEGTAFDVTVDGVGITFRYTTDPGLVSLDRLVLVDAADTADVIATKTAAVIALAFPDELMPTASGPVITVGEPSSIVPAGQVGSLAVVDGGTAGLAVAGVSGGAVPVSYLPTSPATSIAATLQGEIARSGLNVTTFSPGGGTILVSGAQSLLASTDGGAPVNAGTFTPAVADLAGNPVRETRINNETRFTIVMPEVQFDLGDAPTPYPTTFADNGAQHTVASDRLPRLGPFVDTEADGQPGDLDDAVLDVTVTQTVSPFVPMASEVFDIDTSTPDTEVITLLTLPNGGETLKIDIAGVGDRTFELVEITANPTGGNIPVTFNRQFDTLDEIVDRLVRRIRADVPESGDGLEIQRTGSGPAFMIRSVDDEDGISVGTISGRRVFTLPGTDPANVTPDDVLGFLNPLDPAGTTIAVDVFGAGLLHAWIDFDRNGSFDADEQVVTNLPVSGDPLNGTNNFVTVATPADATDGETWMRIRISESGNLLPTGVAVGGEVEDYLVEVISVPLLVPVDDQYAIDEDEVLNTATAAPPNDHLISDNDIGFGSSMAFLPEIFLVGTPPANAQSFTLDTATGNFEYVPLPDFNGTDSFTYRISTQRNANASSAELFATVTIDIAPVNDAPSFDIDAPVVGGLPTLDILERDDNQGTVVDDFAINVFPGPPTATDEAALQNVEFSFPAALNPSVGAGELFSALPQLTPSGQLTVFPNPDQFGVATFVVQAEDREPGNAGFVPVPLLKTFTVRVQPVNDAPRLGPNAGTSASNPADPVQSYAVDDVDFDGDGEIDDATITYTLREDNQQLDGSTQEFFIPLRQGSGPGYNAIGLMDVFSVGPANEVDATPVTLGGDSQVLEFVQAGNAGSLPGDRMTDLGGRLRPVRNSSNELIGYSYLPPLDLNVAFAGNDSFTYSVRDDSTTGGETYSLVDGMLVDDQRTAVNRVELALQPVNDRPEFNTSRSNITVQEDSSLVQVVNFATAISAGPPNTAFDEVDFTTGQTITFNVTPLDFAAGNANDFFSVFPTIDTQSGLLTFRPAANVFGDFRFEVTLMDDGGGDFDTSLPVELTITVQPINDPPIVDPTAAPLSFSLREEESVEILVNGGGSNPGLLDVFFPGPTSIGGDESADIAPRQGGNQTVSLSQPIPTTSAQGGRIEFINDGTPRLRYTPRANFIGMDSFIYTVVDDGVTVGAGGIPFANPRIASNTVSFQVLPVNDAPIFSGATNVQSDEDAGPVSVANWATNVQAGPTGAVDEINGVGTTPPQMLDFQFTQIAGNTSLFLSPPVAVIDSQTGTATLNYESNPDANGSATFEVVLADDGPSDPSNGDQSVSSPPRTFTIDVAAINDPPTFTLTNDLITRLEDSGPFNVVQAVDISPGPADESGQTVAFELQIADEFLPLFSELPTINSDGVLRFTPATNQNTDNANGPAVIRVIARDSDGAETAAVDFQIAITEVNDPPRAFPDQMNTDEDTVLTIDSSFLLQNDIDPDLATNPAEVVRVVMPAISRSVSGALITYDETTGQITYDPTNATSLQALAPGQTLVDSFAYSLVDAAGVGSNLVTVALNVSGINDAPTLGLDTPQLNPNGATTIRVLDNDIDIDGTIDASSIQIELQPSFGSLDILPDGTIVFTPFSSFGVEDVFTYTVADNLGERSQPTFVTISANASPTAVNDAAGTFLDEAIVINVAANDFDSDGSLNLSSIVIVTQPQRGQAVAQSNGTVRYLPDTGFLGRDFFQYRIGDNQGRLSNVARVDTRVVASRLQNPDRSGDVNDDGFVTAIDALLIINRLAEAGTGSIPVLPDDRGPLFLDVNGNRVVTASDALAVINELGRITTEAEQVVPSPQDSLVLLDSDPDESLSTRVEVAAPTELAGPAKLVGVSGSEAVSADVLDLIAADQDSDEEEDSVVAAVDAAMANLL